MKRAAGWPVAAAMWMAAAAWGAPVSGVAARASRTPRIDGAIEAEEWQGATRFENFLQYEPHKGQAATQATVAYFLYDDDQVYFAVHALDDRPERITARLTRRDADLAMDDSVTIYLDTFHDRRTCYFFATNPLGTQTDGSVKEDGRVQDLTWDAPWRAAARRTADGWTAEFAIPLRVLMFRTGADRTWGLNIGRTRRSNLERTFWAGPLESPFRVSQYGELRGMSLERGGARRYELIPYVLGRWEQGRTVRGDLGMDVRYTFQPETRANLTINPDFATIEADQEFVNLTRFEPQLIEKRPFFLESNDRFRQRIQTFYSRRIGEIDFGGKLLSRQGPWDATVLSARSASLPFRDGRTGATRMGRAQYTVARVERQVLRSSTVSGMLSNRALGGVNQGAMSIDTTLHPTRIMNFTGQLVRTHGPYQEGRWAWFARPAWDSATGHFHFRYTHLGERVGDNLNAIGFLRDDDHREMDSDLDKTLWPKSGPVQKVTLQSKNNIYFSQRKILRSYHNIETAIVEFRNRWSVGAEHTNDFKLFEKGFHNDTANVFFGYNTREYNSFDAGFITGRNFDSDLRAASFAARRKLTAALAVEYRLSRVWLDPDPRRQATLIHIVRAQQNFTRDLFVRVFFQSNSVIDRRNAEAVFVWRYKPPFGSVQFAYQRGRAEFGQRSEQGNTYFVKVAHVF